MNERAGSSASDPGGQDASPGSALSAALVEARQAHGLTQSDVADQLYLPPELIRQIDEGRFASIARPAYIKGYLRSYARLVGLPGDELVNQFEQVNSGGSVAQGELRDVTEEEVGSSKLTGPVATTGLYGLGGLVLIFVLVWIYSLNEGDNEGDRAVGTTIEASGESIESGIIPVNVRDRIVPVDDTSADGRVSESMTGGASGDTAPLLTMTDAGTVQNHSIDMDGSTFEISSNEEDWTTLQDEDPGLPLTPLDVDGESVADFGEPDPGEGEGSIGNSSDGPVAVTTAVTNEVRRDGDRLLISVQANGPDHLYFTVQDDCWIEVTDANGTRVYGDLNHAGDEVDLYGLAPFHVLVGRAQAVTIRFNDEPVELEPNTLNNTAKLNLGN